MIPISDEDLVLYRYRDGLDAARIAEIGAALAASSDLRARYAAIEQAVAGFDATAVAPAPALAARVWRQLEPRLVEAGVIVPRPGVAARLRAFFAPPAPARLAWAGACAILLAIGVGYLAGRNSVNVTPPLAATGGGADADAAAARVLDAYVAAHLRATEGVLLTASNSDDATLLEGNRELAESLVESNHLYALAAARAGNPRLAVFLRQLEPVLLSLANQSGAATVESSEDLRQYLGKTDLLFQVRATEARLDQGDGQRL
jgi:hypothetical protein